MENVIVGWLGMVVRKGLSDGFLRVARLAVDFLAPVGRVRGEELRGFAVWGGVVFRAVGAVACTLEELSRVAEGHAVQVALVGMPSWYWEMVLAIEFEFLLDDAERLLGDFALDGPI
jgi:hypothetical protein